MNGVSIDLISESYVQSQVRLESGRAPGVLLMRNNNGAFKDETGRVVRYGLANDSKAVNKETKSSDLIGWRSVIITPAMIGQQVAIFLAREIKRADWVYTGTEEEMAQKRFIDLVNAAGGDAMFTTGVGTL